MTTHTGPSAAHAPEADGIPMRPATWRSWGSDERLIWLELQRAGDLANEAEHEAVAAMGNCWETVKPLWERHQQYAAEQYDGELRLLVARLKRYLPQFEDLIEWAHGIGMDYNSVYKPFYELKSSNA